MSERQIGHSHNFVDVHLMGPVVTRAYEFGTGAARLGSVTLLAEDRNAAPSLGLAAIVLQDVMPILGPHIPRLAFARPGAGIVTAFVRMQGRQLIKDFEAVPADAALDHCGHARFRFGSVRLTVRDRDAAESAATALADAYAVAVGAFGGLPDLAQLRTIRDARRDTRAGRRPYRISTPGAGLLAPAPPLADRHRNEHVL